MKELELIIFDMDGLMFDTERVTCRAYLEVGKEWGVPVSEEQYKLCLGRGREDVLRMYEDFFSGIADGEAIYREVGARSIETIRRDGTPVKPGLYALLDVIKERKIPVAIASGSDGEIIENNLRHAGLSGQFDMILSSQDPRVKRGKPAPDIFLAICGEMHAAPEHTLVLEDSVNGVKAALAGGFPVINIPDMVELPPALQGECLGVEKTLADVVKYL